MRSARLQEGVCDSPQDSLPDSFSGIIKGFVKVVHASQVLWDSAAESRIQVLPHESNLLYRLVIPLGSLKETATCSYARSLQKHGNSSWLLMQYWNKIQLLLKRLPWAATLYRISANRLADMLSHLQFPSLIIFNDWSACSNLCSLLPGRSWRIIPDAVQEGRPGEVDQSENTGLAAT